MHVIGPLRHIHGAGLDLLEQIALLFDLTRRIINIAPDAANRDAEITDTAGNIADRFFTREPPIFIDILYIHRCFPRPVLAGQRH